MSKSKSAPRVPAKKAGAGKGIDEFRAAHDKSYIVPKRIREALVQLGNSWEYEVEFIKRCGLSTTDFAMYRDEFKSNYVETGGRQAKRVWAGTPEFANKLREAIR